jgi:NADH-quinone oxidoreductase subunit L
LARVFTLLGWDVLQLITVVGALTAFMGAVAAMTQHDIKRVLAFSTISQLGYMVMGLGTGAYDAALFHLFTHAFFKAGLFLAAGSVIYSLHQYEKTSGVHLDPQDMRQMGGLRKFMPVTFVSYTILAMALAGLPLFSGFLSKDAIILGAFAWAGEGWSWKMFIPILGLITVALTAYYMMRQIILVFYGSFRSGENPVLSESPRIMRYVLIFLSIMSLGIIWSLNPLDPAGSWIMNALRPPILKAPDILENFQVLVAERAATMHTMISLFSIAMIMLGAVLAIRKFRLSGPWKYKTIGTPEGPIGKISYANWYLDSVYQYAIVDPLLWSADLIRKTDTYVIDGFINFAGGSYVVISNVVAWLDKVLVDGIVNFTGRILRILGSAANGLTRGNIQYLVLVAVLFAIILIWLVI